MIVSEAKRRSLEGPHVYKGVLDLARLPWFEVDHGRLVNALPDEVGPVVDVHTHLALAYLRPMGLDLHKASPTQHYLPSCCTFDLDPYVNRNFSESHLSALNKDLVWGSLTRGGMRASHTVPNLVGEMKELGITRSVLLPIDFPAISKNHAHVAEAAKSEEYLVAFGSVHPYASNKPVALDEQAHRGATGIKVHPNVQCVRPDDPQARALYAECGKRNLPILIHCGPVGIEPALGRYLTQVKWYERGIAENPGTIFILGHAGALQFEQALALQRTYPNVYLETSSQGLPNVRAMAERADPDRVLFGSDWPFYHQAIPLAKVLIATEGKPEVRRKFLYENAARLFPNARA